MANLVCKGKRGAKKNGSGLCEYATKAVPDNASTAEKQKVCDNTYQENKTHGVKWTYQQCVYKKKKGTDAYKCWAKDLCTPPKPSPPTITTNNTNTVK